MTLYRDSRGAAVELDRQLGQGGEAVVHSVRGQPSIAAKLFQSPGSGRERKLRAMLANQPADPTAPAHRSICWPTSTLFDGAGRFVGFLMPRLDLQRMRSLAVLYHPGQRSKVAPGFDWRYLMHTAANAAAVVDALNQRGYVVGDLNDRNLLARNDTLVTIVDCDSIQVREGHQLHRCVVGSEGFVAPELLGRDLSLLDRTADHDSFALAVLVFQLLMEGNHPFSGRWTGPGPDPSIDQNVSDGRFPFGAGRGLLPRPACPPFDMLPSAIQTLFARAFIDGHSSPTRRPRAGDWVRELRKASAGLAECSARTNHVYAPHLQACPWCERTKLLGGLDPFPGKKRAKRAVARPRPRPAAPKGAKPPLPGPRTFTPPPAPRPAAVVSPLVIRVWTPPPQATVHHTHTRPVAKVPVATSPSPLPLRAPHMIAGWRS